MDEKAKLYFDELWHWLWFDEIPTGTLGEKHAELEAKYGKNARIESEAYILDHFRQSN